VDVRKRSKKVKILLSFRRMEKPSFFRWMPTAIILWVFGVGHAIGAVLCLLFAREAAQDEIKSHDAPTLSLLGSQNVTEWFLRGAIADAVVAAFCLFGWYLMSLRRPGTTAMGAILTLFAASIIGLRSALYLIRGAGFLNWCDLVLVLPFLFYAIIYAYRECREGTVQNDQRLSKETQTS
jgi:hypothetical protein